MQAITKLSDLFAKFCSQVKLVLIRHVLQQKPVQLHSLAAIEKMYHGFLLCDRCFRNSDLTQNKVLLSFDWLKKGSRTGHLPRIGLALQGEQFLFSLSLRDFVEH